MLVLKNVIDKRSEKMKILQNQKWNEYNTSSTIPKSLSSDPGLQQNDQCFHAYGAEGGIPGSV